MAFTGRRVSVGTTATQILSGRENGVIRNGGAASVFLGGPTVTTTDGFELPPGSSMELAGFQDSLWGIVSSGTVAVHVLGA